RRAAAGAGGDEADRDRAPGAAHGRRGHRRGGRRPPPALRRVRGAGGRDRRGGDGRAGAGRRGRGEVRRRQRHRDPPQRALLPRRAGRPVSPLIVLVGPIGVGKSTVGRLLAERRAGGHRDTDDDIAAARGRSTADIFVEDGEDAFRALEKDAVRGALRGHDGVLSLGGGAVLDAGTRALLAAQRVVYLSMDV